MEKMFLGEVADITKLAGFEFTQHVNYVDDGDIIAVRALNLKDGELVLNDVKRISKQTSEELKRSQLKKNDIVISYTGTIGECAQIDEDNKYHLAPNVAKITPGNAIDPNFLFQYIRSSKFKKLLKSYCHGSTQPTIPMKVLREIPIQIPSIDDQKKISKVLKNLDKKIHINKLINQNLNEQVQALFKSWFVDFEPFSGSIPLDWKNIIFAEILTPVTEKSNDEKIPMYSVTDTGLFPRDKKFKKKLSMTNAKCKVIRNNDLVFGMSREILNWGVMHEPLGRVSAAYNVYHVSNDVDSYYLEHYIKAHSQYFKDLIRPASREGQGIDKALLMEKEIYLPSKAVLDHYYEIENPIIEIINSCEEENICLESLRDTLLPRLMSGELDITNIDI